MPSVLTGANLANRDLLYLGVSGDGDSASIGLGQFAHAMRRGVRMAYIVENNGVYGLTKGQFSATADQGSKSKKGVVNSDSPVDLVAMALQLGATYVGARLLGQQGAAGAADQGRDRPRRRRLHRRDQPLRGLQQPPGQHQELRLRARAQRGGEPHRLHHARASEITARAWRRARWWTCASTTARCCACAACTPTTTPPTATPPWPTCRRTRRWARCVTGLLYVDPLATDLHTALNTSDAAAQRAGRGRAVPGRRGAGKTQRILALAARCRRTVASTSRRVAPWPNAPFSSPSRRSTCSASGPQASVREAAGVMTRANCGSVLIMEPPDTLLGIVTERDLMTRVLARALDPETTTAARGHDAATRSACRRRRWCPTPW